MSDKIDYNPSIDALAIEIRYMNSSLQDVKSEVHELRQVVTQLQIKAASHATIFGLVGGMLTAFGSSMLKKLFGA